LGIVFAFGTACPLGPSFPLSQAAIFLVYFSKDVRICMLYVLQMLRKVFVFRFCFSWPCFNFVGPPFSCATVNYATLIKSRCGYGL